MNLIPRIVLGPLVSVAVGFFVGYWFCGRRKLYNIVYAAIMPELDRHYLCGYSIYKMLQTGFPHRFGHFNNDGFCYTFSAAIALALKQFHSVRIVRGSIRKEDYGEHSWMEVRYLCHWWVIDPVLYQTNLIDRPHYYNSQKPKVKVIYHYKQIWRDPAASQIYDCLCQPKTSKVFLELYNHYTPKAHTAKGKALKIESMDTLIDSLPNDGTCYYTFNPANKLKFSQGIVNDFMTKPTRRSPRRRTLRRLERFYRQHNTQPEAQTPT